MSKKWKGIGMSKEIGKEMEKDKASIKGDKFDSEKVVIPEEKREFTRCKICLGVEVVLFTGVRVEGKTEDISMSGLLLRTERGLPIGTEVKIHLFLRSGGDRCDSLNLMGTVVRIDERGVAIQFNEMDSESFEHLKRLLTYNIEKDKDAEKLNEEFETHLGIRRRIV